MTVGSPLERVEIEPMIRWRNLLIPLVVSALAALCVGVPFWDSSKPALLVALSVVAAGVLVRLARGLPFTSVDHYEVDEIRRLSKAVAQSIRSLKALIICVFISIAVLTVAKPISDYIALEPYTHKYSTEGSMIVSGIAGFFLSYVILRMFQVVNGDQELTELQSAFIIRAVERKQAKKFEDQQIPAGEPFKTPVNYGKIIQ